MKPYTPLFFVCVLLSLLMGLDAAMAESRELKLPPLPIFGPTALTGDPGDGRAYLRWNLQIEDTRVVGWKVQQLAPNRKELTNERLTKPEHVALGLRNGTAYTFAVTGVLKGGGLTPPSNTVTVTPKDVGTALSLIHI